MTDKDIQKLIESKTKDALHIRMQHIEQMCCAYYRMTDIPPDQVELVEQRDGTTIKWFFRNRTA